MAFFSYDSNLMHASSVYYLSIALVLVSLLLTSTVIRRRYLSPIKDIPGPLLASITRLHHVYHIFKGKQSHWITKLHEEHGPFVRIAPDEVSVSHPDAPKKLLLSVLHKGPFYHVGAMPDYRFQNAISLCDPKDKMRLSRSVGPAYSANYLLKSEDHIDEVVVKLLRWMDGYAADHKPMDLDHYLAYTAFDTVGELFFSRSFGFIDQGRDIGGSLAAAKSVQAMGTMLGYFHWLFYLLVNPFTTWLGCLPLGYMYNTTMQAVKERQKNPDARFDGLALWMKTHQDTPERLSLREMYATSTAVVQAGAETVSSAIQTLLYHTIRHPETWQRMQEEIAGEQVKGKCLDPVISFADTQDLPYLRACVNESMRMLGPLGMGLQRVVPAQGLELGGREFTAGTVLSVHVPTLHLDPAIWGPDSHDFRPERWFEKDIAQKETCFVPWSQGYCTCPGQPLAKIEIAKICATIVRDYDIHQVDPEQDWKYEVYFSVCPYDWPVHIKKRQCKTDL